MAGIQLFSDRFIRHGCGLDLVDDHNAVFVRKDAVRPAFQREPDALHCAVSGQEHFCLIAVAGGFLQSAVDACTLVGTVKSGKAAVDAAGAQEKFHQLPDGQADVGHGVHFLLS